MYKGISLYSIVPVRTEPRESAEQSTQILFGETFDILEKVPRWNRVKLHLDNQEGWVDTKMICPMTAKEYRTYHAAYKEAAYVLFPVAYVVSENNGQTIPLTAGTRLTHYRDGHFEVLGVRFRIDPGMVAAEPLELTEQNLQQVVRFFLNTPYLWGGKNAMGMDCSGFTQTIMSLFGHSLRRNAGEQVTQGKRIQSLKNAHAGDLVFFDHEDGRISHVGIILQSAIINQQPAITVVHCSGRVKVEKLDETGIFSIEQSGYTHHLVAIRRLA
jgi:hypothetical protein